MPRSFAIFSRKNNRIEFLHLQLKTFLKKVISGFGVQTGMPEIEVHSIVQGSEVSNQSEHEDMDELFELHETGCGIVFGNTMTSSFEEICPPLISVIVVTLKNQKDWKEGINQFSQLLALVDLMSVKYFGYFHIYYYQYFSA